MFGENILAKFDLTKAEYDDLVSKIFLSDEEKQIFTMKLLGEYEVKIADTLGMSTKTVQRKWKRIKDKVKRVI